MALIKIFTSSEIATKAEKVFNSIYTIEDIAEGNTFLMHKKAWDIAIKQLKEEFKPNKASFKDVGFQDLEGFEDIVFNLLKINDETIPKEKLFRYCKPIEKVYKHMVNVFENYENISPKVAIIEVSKVNTELRERFYKEKQKAFKGEY